MTGPTGPVAPRPWSDLSPEEREKLLEIEATRAQIEDQTGVRPDFVGIIDPGFDRTLSQADPEE